MGIEHTIANYFNGYKTIRFNWEDFIGLLADLENLTYYGIRQTIARFVDEHEVNNR